MTTTAVLNPTLYQRLVSTFKHVRIAHQGENQIRRIVRNLTTNKLEVALVQAGETYKICCPFCSDTRFRCNINYMYGQKNELGQDMKHLAHCFNAGCPLSIHEREAYNQLFDILTANKIKDLSKVSVREGKTIDVDTIRANWPGKVVRIDELPDDHEACVYLRDERHFNVSILAKSYDVHWCFESDKKLCTDRLIIPIYRNKTMVGWQARPAFDIDWSTVNYPKYYTAPGTPKNHILYNLDNARKYKTGIIVEGVTDVWRIGANAVCTLGASLSKAQQDLFVENFKDHSGVLLYDPDLPEKAPKLWSSLLQVTQKLNNRLAGGFCQLCLPSGTDPASFSRSRKELRSYIQQHATVNVEWSKR